MVVLVYVAFILSLSPPTTDHYEGDPSRVVYMYAEEKVHTDFSQQEHVYRISAILDGGPYPLSEVTFRVADLTMDPIVDHEIEFDDVDVDGLLSFGDRIYLHNVTSAYDGGYIMVLHQGAEKGLVRIGVKPFESRYHFILEQQTVIEVGPNQWDTSFKVVWEKDIPVFFGYPIANLEVSIDDTNANRITDADITIDDSDWNSRMNVGDRIVIEDMTSKYDGGALVLTFGGSTVLSIATIHL
jgi:hypothetical protein